MYAAGDGSALADAAKTADDDAGHALKQRRRSGLVCELLGALDGAPIGPHEVIQPAPLLGAVEVLASAKAIELDDHAVELLHDLRLLRERDITLKLEQDELVNLVLWDS
jgi:hypothetical protein